MKNSLIFFSCVCAIVLCSMLYSSLFISCVKRPLTKHQFTVNVEKIYVDEEQEVAILIIGDDSSGVEIVTDIPIHVIYALLEEKEEIVLSNDTSNIYMYAKDNLK